ncbi:MAG TPA: aspartate--tRNA ligase [bacterium]|nr:aspartate--tRNA ligase [bacterium]
MALDYTGRTHTCGGISAADLGKTVTLCGWVRHVRDLGGIVFIRLWDRYGESQVVADPEHAPEAGRVAADCHLEYVVVLRGAVRRRPADQVRPDQPTGEVEVLVDSLEVLSPAKPLPFPIADDPLGSAPVNEELRLRHRYLDLRRGPMAEMLRFRHRFMLAMRNRLAEAGFLEIETPVLTRSTPEGARDFLVPSRVYPGSFYALPQSPQMYKQLLMVAGADRYFQIARCFRDEDARSDRQVEFTQLDLEMSFAGVEEVFAVTEGLFGHLWAELLGVELPVHWPRMTYAEAQQRYGSDKPDTRFGLELVTLSEVFRDTELSFIKGALDGGGVVRGIRVPGQAGASRKTLDVWENIARSAGAGGLVWVKWLEDGSWNASIKKYLTDAAAGELMKLCGAGPGDLLLLAAGPAGRVNTALSRLRLALGDELGLIPPGRWDVLWVVEFPLFETDDQGRLTSSHHPFTMPHPDDLERLESDPLSVRSASYDIVVNGVEIASGSPRIHDHEVQRRVFHTLGLSEEAVRERFGFFLEGLSYGTPPHAGIAPGLDRLIALMLGRENIREVIPFPKTLRAYDPLTDAPSAVDPAQLAELGLRLEGGTKKIARGGDEGTQSG